MTGKLLHMSNRRRTKFVTIQVPEEMLAPRRTDNVPQVTSRPRELHLPNERKKTTFSEDDAMCGFISDSF